MPDQPEFKLKISTQSQTEGGNKKLKDVETKFSKAVQARKRTINTIKRTALLLDDISKVQKGLEVGGGVVSIAGESLQFISLGTSSVFNVVISNLK